MVGATVVVGVTVVVGAMVEVVGAAVVVVGWAVVVVAATVVGVVTGDRWMIRPAASEPVTDGHVDVVAFAHANADSDRPRRAAIVRNVSPAAT